MSVISFRVVSIDLKDSTLHNINQNNLVRLNVTQRPNHDTEEYLLKNASCLNNINHEFVIQDPTNKVERLTLTVRSVLKKTSVASIFNLEDDKPKMRKPKDRSVDHYIQGCKESHEGCIDCEYYESLNSLIGYRNIEIKELKKGISNIFHMELITRGNVKVVGYVNLEIYIWDCLTKNNLAKKSTPVYNEPILFVDPGCQVNTEHINY